MAATFNYPSRPDPPDLLTTHPDMDPEFVATYAAGVNATMTSAERMYALWQATRHVITTGVRGALVECGVWRGGSSMVMAHTMLTVGVSDRELWLYDTFEGMPPPEEADDPAQAPSEIALLRLDTDWESSTRHELEHLWPRLAVGGVLIIDDYGHWSGARQAVDGYFAARDDAPLLARVDYTGRMGVRDRRSDEE